MKVAVIGLGSAGSRHARNLLELGHEVVGFDPVASPPVGTRTSASIEAAIESADAVVVASPNAFHASQACAALEHGRPVLVEKPLATTVTDAELVVEAADRAGVVAAVAMNLRFHPGIVELKRLVDAGALGRILLAQVSFGYDLRLWRPNHDYRQSYSARADLGGGIVLDAIHELDYLLWLLGPIVSVSAEEARVSDLEIEVEDAAVAVLRFASGALATVDLNFFEPAYRRRCVVVGSKAVSDWDWVERTVTVRCDSEEDRTADVGAPVSETYRSVIANFLDGVATGAPVRASLRSGLDAVAVAGAIRQSAHLGQRVAIS
jgi:predicted dehydrogenase